MGNACCGAPPSLRSNRWGQYSADEAALYDAALDGDVARVSEMLAMPGVRPDRFRHVRVRTVRRLSLAFQATRSCLC